MDGLDGMLTATFHLNPLGFPAAVNRKLRNHAGNKMAEGVS